MTQKNVKCKICNNTENNFIFKAKEMMFGTRDEFEYVECSNCKCIYLIDDKIDLTKYYPKNYTSFVKKYKVKDDFIKFYIKRFMAEGYLSNKNSFLVNTLIKMFGVSFLSYIKSIKLNLDSKILDVGSGNGERILGLSRYGFNNLIGIDPFIEKDILYNKKVKVLKKDLFSLNEKFDFIMLNHSFEHMVIKPEKILQKLNDLLEVGSYLLIRIPVSNSYAWKKYKENWVALDPPRHIYLHNENTMNILSTKTGFKVEKVTYDSSEYQFYGSIQYSKGISMLEENSYYINPEKSIFTKEEIDNFKVKAQELNQEKNGDTASFYLRKI